LFSGRALEGYRVDLGGFRHAVHPGDNIGSAPLLDGGDGGYIKRFFLKDGTEF
jgi:hypothetical protein